MTASTRRRLVTCVIAILLTIPAESILLRTLSAASQTQAARNWVESLTYDQIRAAADAVETYPFAYRREILRKLSAAERAGVWRRNIAKYISAHPDLDESVLGLLKQAASLATSEQFTSPSDDGRAKLAQIAQQTNLLLGKEDTLELFYRLGPKDGSQASALPVSEQLANFLRSHFVAQADAEDCDCNTDFGCDGGGSTYCRSGVSCNRDEDWPMCGWWWNEVCDGLCSGGIAG